MRVLIAGLGSIGRRHLANVRALEPEAEITVLRHARGASGVPPGADGVVYSLEEAALGRPDAALLCGPSITHAEAGMALVAAGAHLFVEKPLAVEVDAARALVAACAARQRVLVVGYNLRFSQSLRALRAELLRGSIGRPMTLRAEVGQYLPEWRCDSDYRTSASARSDLGGGVTLELSHEFDYVRWLLGEATDVRAVTARLGDLHVDVEDTAEVIVRFATGAIASVHLDMVQRSTTRTCRIAGVSGTLLWDAVLQTVKLYRPGDGWTDVGCFAAVDRNETYVAEVENFFAAVRGETAPAVSGTDGVRALEIAAAARLSAECERTVTLAAATAVR